MHRSARRRGESPVDFIRARALRLAQPALPLLLFVSAALSIATLAGLAPDLFDAAAVGVGMPLWFLAAYLLCQAAVPTMTALHARAPATTLAALLAGVLLVDAVRFSTGIEQVGLVNIALYALSLVTARWEAVGELGPTPPVWAVVVAVVLAFVPPFAVIEYDLSLALAIVGAVFYALAVLLLRWPSRRSA